jgi:outer membrane protein assembly factor BamB
MLTNGGLLLGADDIAGGGVGGSGLPGAAFGFTINANGTLTLADTAGVPDGFDQISAVVATDDSTYWCSGGSCNAITPPGVGGFTQMAGWATSPGNTSSATSDLALDERFTGNLMILMGVWQDGVSGGSQKLVSVAIPSGSQVWSVTLPAPTAAQTNASYIGIADATVGNSCPAIGSDGTVYVGNFDGLHAVDGATGLEKAGFPFPTTSDVLTAPAVGGDGTIFFGTADGTFYAIHPDGTPRFKLTAGGRIAGSPAIGPSGAVYFTADDGFLYAVN